MFRRALILSSIAVLLSACSNDTPTAGDVIITDLNGGDLVVGDTVSAAYTYSDDENNPEGESTFRWLRGETAIAGAVSKTYKVTAADVGKIIYFEVTPVASAGNKEGDSVRSAGLTVKSAVVPDEVKISGTVTFDRIPATLTGLDYNNIVKSPLRKAKLEVLDQSGKVITTTTTDANGKYSVTVSSQTPVKIRVRAEMPAYNVKVVDNVNSGAQYVLDGSLVTSGEADSTRNLHAPSGWDGAKYASAAARKAAPFAILDSMYLASEKIKAADADAVYSPLLVNWSVNNVPADGSTELGQIGTSHYSTDDSALYILGKENTDTDEFDDHVMLHEWGHYFEDKFSRSDSMGGPHSDADILDMRIAFGEAWGNALSGMLTNDPSYRDTSGTMQKETFEIDVENSPADPEVQGFYGESSLQRVLYDLYDDTNEVDTDQVALGFTPIYKTMVGRQKNAPAYTSVFTFITALKANYPGQSAAFDALTSMENIDPISDVFGSSQTDNLGDADVLPIYTELTPNGATVNRCAVKTFDPTNMGNRLSIRRYFNFNIPVAGNYEVTVTKTSGSGNNPVFSVAQSSPFVKDKIKGDSNTPGVQIKSGALAAGQHVMEVYDFESTEGAGGDLCFDVKIAPAQ